MKLAGRLVVFGLYVLTVLVLFDWIGIVDVHWPWEEEEARQYVQTPASLEQIGQLEQRLREYPGVFNWKVHNELRHLYSLTDDQGRSMQHSNIILQHSHMDDYILNILSGWQIDKNISKARANLLMNARSFSDRNYSAQKK